MLRNEGWKLTRLTRPKPQHQILTKLQTQRIRVVVGLNINFQIQIHWRQNR